MKKFRYLWKKNLFSARMIRKYYYPINRLIYHSLLELVLTNRFSFLGGFCSKIRLSQHIQLFFNTPFRNRRQTWHFILNVQILSFAVKFVIHPPPPPSLHFGPPYSISLLPSFQPTASKPLHTATFIADKLPNYCTWNESPAPLTKRERRDRECARERKRHRDMVGGRIQLFLSLLRTQTSCPLSSLGNYCSR